MHIYYIDTYFDTNFFSRSEPIYNKDYAIKQIQELQQHVSNKFSFKLNISLEISDYNNLVKASQRVHTHFEENNKKYINNTNINTNINNNNTRNLKCYRYYEGYIFLKNKKNYRYLSSKNLLNKVDFYDNIGYKGSYYLDDKTIKNNNLKFNEENIKVLPSYLLISKC